MTRDPHFNLIQVAMIATVAVTMMTLSACHERKYNRYLHARDTISLNAGDAIAHNKAVHTIDPWPAHSRNPRHTTNGKRILLGMERYQENQSLEPQGLNTTTVYEEEQGPTPPPPGAGGGGTPSP